jgi:hypothetical protein
MFKLISIFHLGSEVESSGDEGDKMKMISAMK